MPKEPPLITHVDGHELSLSNLHKVLFPAVGVTKAELIHYYSEVAPTILPHLKDKVVTRVRMPDGVGKMTFFEKNAPKGAPTWIRTQAVKGDEVTDYVVIRSVADLVYLANLAAIELHVPQWRIPDAEKVDGAVRLDTGDPKSRAVVMDLDPGEGVTMVDSARAALVIAGLLAELGLVPYVKTSGSKGLQIYAPIAPTPASQLESWARAFGELASERDPGTFVLTQTKTKRVGKILIDHMQNKAARTTVCPYSVRGREGATVSTPVTWDEVAAVTSPDDLRFTMTDVLDRIQAHGDLFAPLLEKKHPKLPTL